MTAWETVRRILVDVRVSRFDFLGGHRDGRQGLTTLILPLGVPTFRIRVATGEGGGLVLDGSVRMPGGAGHAYFRASLDLLERLGFVAFP